MLYKDLQTQQMQADETELCLCGLQNGQVLGPTGATRRSGKKSGSETERPRITSILRRQFEDVRRLSAAVRPEMA